MVVAIRSAWLAQDADRAALIGGALALAVGLTWAIAHRLRWFDAARIADQRSGGEDRITTAYELAALSREDAWALVQAGDACRWATGTSVQRLMPWRRPRAVGPALLGAALVIAAALIPLPWTVQWGPPLDQSGLKLTLPAASPHLRPATELLSEDDVELVTDDVELLRQIEEQVHGPTREWLRKVRKTLEKVAKGELDKRGALKELATLEKQRPIEQRSSPQPTQARSPDPRKDASSTASPEQRSRDEAARDKAVRSSIAEALKQSLKAAPKSKERDELQQAAQKKDLDAISKWVEKMAQRNWSDKELQKWIKVAEKFADKLGNKALDKKFDRLRKQVERLQRKRERQGGLNAADRRRLKNTRRNLQSLRRQHGDQQAAKYQLQRLQRNTKKAVDQMRRQQKSRLARRNDKRAHNEARRQRQQQQQQQRRSFQRNMSRAAQELRRMSEQQKSRQARRIGESRIRQTREALGRAGRESQSREDFERRARQQRRQQAGQQGKQQQKDRSAQGQQRRKAQGGTRAEAQRKAQAKQAAQQRAGQGQARNGRSKFRLGGSDMPDDPRMRMMRDNGTRRQLSQMKRGGGEAPGQATGADPAGDKSQRLGAARTEKVKGIDNEGPTIKQTFIEAAKKGFARQRWGKVYADYNAVAESMMARQGLPPGRRALVRRYFELIRPRPTEEQR